MSYCQGCASLTTALDKATAELAAARAEIEEYSLEQGSLERVLDAERDRRDNAERELAEAKEVYGEMREDRDELANRWRLSERALAQCRTQRRQAEIERVHSAVVESTRDRNAALTQMGTATAARENAERERDELHKRLRGLAMDSGAVLTDDPVEDVHRAMEAGVRIMARQVEQERTAREKAERERDGAVAACYAREGQAKETVYWRERAEKAERLLTETQHEWVKNHERLSTKLTNAERELARVQPVVEELKAEVERLRGQNDKG